MEDIGFSMISRFKDVLVKPEAPVLDAMKTINFQPHGRQFVIVVDDEGKLLGTLTDGDVRRALLSGQSLEGAVHLFMNCKPIYGLVTSTAAELDDLLFSLSSANPFLPIVKDDMSLLDVKVQSERVKPDVCALVLAGGFGKRLGKRTEKCPKPLLAVNGKPMLIHVLERLNSIEASRTFLAVHYLSEKIENFLLDRPEFNFVSTLHESEPLGTAGAISLIPKIREKNLLVTNSDIITDLNYALLLQFHTQGNFDVTIAASDHQVQIPFGVIKYDMNGEFLFIDEKPTVSNYVAAGVYCFKSHVCELIKLNEKIDMPELISKCKSKGMKIGVFPIHEQWQDFGRPEDFEPVSVK